VKIHLLGLEDGTHTFDKEVTGAALGLSPGEYPDSVLVTVVVDRRGVNWYIKVTARTDAHLYCDRCATPFTLPLAGHLSLLYTTNTELTQGEDDDALRRLNGQNDPVDLSDDARQAVLLDLPAKALCREDCQGLCAQCGADLNEESCGCPPPPVDPRWAALQALKD